MKRIVQSALGRFGYELRRREAPVAEVGMVASYLSRLGHPKTVFDVGVGFGTYELYRAFPKPKFVLIEPLKDYEPAITDIAAEYDCLVIYAAAGDRVGAATIRVDPANLELTTFGTHNEGHLSWAANGGPRDPNHDA